MRFLLLFISLLSLSFLGYSQPTGYTYGKQILIDHNQVIGSTPHINFPVLISLTDNSLRSTSNGGKIENTNGFDIVFTLGDCSTLLDHQIEKYDPNTGEYIAWVRIPSLPTNSDFGFHMYYGNSSVSSDPSSSNVWSSDYRALYHMNQSPSNNLIDYTSNNNNGTPHSSMSTADLVNGKIGNGIDFDGANDFYDCGNSTSTNPTGDWSASAWFFSRGISGHIINKGGGWNDPGYSLFFLRDGIRVELQRASEKDVIDNASTQNTWNYVVATYNQTSGIMKCYLNGVLQSNTGNHTGPIGTPVENLNIGRKEQNGVYFNGIIDEARVMLSEKNGDWVSTEYNNQNTPSTFYEVSSEYSAANLCTVLPVELLNFKLSTKNNSTVKISWQTASERNNDFFTIEKSKDAKNWKVVTTINGAGNSTSLLNYNVNDAHPFLETSYYRLKQTDFDGSFEYSNIRSINLKDNSISWTLFPNPSNETVNMKGNNISSIQVYNLIGLNVSKQIHINQKNENHFELNISDIPIGTYLVKCKGITKRLIKR